MFIAFEGIDGAGKTTLSLALCEYLNKKYKPEDSYLWTKEPDFSSEEADILNSLKGTTASDREAAFLSSRIKHQNIIREHSNIICDRYVWSALAYSLVHSFVYYPLLERVYTNESVFMPPDLYIFVDTQVSTCAKRLNENNTTNRLKLCKLSVAYEQTSTLIKKTPIITISSCARKNMSEEDSINIDKEDMISKIENHIRSMKDDERV